MRDGWERTTLGEIAEVIMGQSPPGSSYNVEGGGLPFIQGSGEFGDVYPSPARWCDSPRKVAEVGDLLVSVRAPVGDTNRVRERIAIGRGLAVLRGGPSVLTDYLWLLIPHSAVALQGRSSAGMFQSITAQGLRGLSLVVPPLAEQRRIVDLVRSCDTALSAAALEISSTHRLLSGLREVMCSTSVETAVLGDIATLATGPSWKADQESRERGDGRLPVVGITNTPEGGQLDLNHLTYVSGLPAKTRRLDPSAVLLIRTNGNRGRIGNAYRIPAEATGHAFSAFQTAVFPHDSEDSAYLFQALSATSMQERISQAASGSTGLGNIAISWLRCLELPWPEEYERRRAAEVADAAGAVASAAQAEHQRLNRLRSTLLDELLSGRRAIPESYDRLLDAAS